MLFDEPHSSSLLLLLVLYLLQNGLSFMFCSPLPIQTSVHPFGSDFRRHDQDAFPLTAQKIVRTLAISFLPLRTINGCCSKASGGGALL